MVTKNFKISQMFQKLPPFVKEYCSGFAESRRHCIFLCSLIILIILIIVAVCVCVCTDTHASTCRVKRDLRSQLSFLAVQAYVANIYSLINLPDPGTTLSSST